jgi:hypothetical protein
LRLKTILLSLAILVCSVTTATAVPVTIDFEDLADGDSVTNQYPGLTFSNAVVLTAGISLNEFEFPARSGSNVISDDGGPILISFATPLRSFGGYFTYLTPLTLTAFDASVNPLGSISSSFLNNLALSGDPGSSPNELLQFSSPLGISSVALTGDSLGGSFTLDDVTIDPVPEPGTLALLGLGLAGLARHRWLKRRSSQCG